MEFTERIEVERRKREEGLLIALTSVNTIQSGN
jgi:hypothetical protein